MLPPGKSFKSHAYKTNNRARTMSRQNDKTQRACANVTTYPTPTPFITTCSLYNIVAIILFVTLFGLISCSRPANSRLSSLPTATRGGCIPRLLIRKNDDQIKKRIDHSLLNVAYVHCTGSLRLCNNKILLTDVKQLFGTHYEGFRKGSIKTGAK